jgi:hypothetical protein
MATDIRFDGVDFVVLDPLPSPGSLGGELASSTNFTLTAAHVGRLVNLTVAQAVTLPAPGTIPSGAMFILKNESTSFSFLILNGNSTDAFTLKIAAGETLIIHCNGSGFYRVIARMSRTPVYTEGGTVYSYNTVYQAPGDMTLVVLLTGSYMNGVQLLVGDTSSPAIPIAQFGDDLNSNTKYASISVPIQGGTYFQVAPLGAYAWETVTITGYAHK